MATGARKYSIAMPRVNYWCGAETEIESLNTCRAPMFRSLPSRVGEKNPDHLTSSFQSQSSATIAASQHCSFWTPTEKRSRIYNRPSVICSPRQAQHLYDSQRTLNISLF